MALEVSNNASISDSNIIFNYISVVKVMLVAAGWPSGWRQHDQRDGHGHAAGQPCRFGGVPAIAATFISAGVLNCASPAQLLVTCSGGDEQHAGLYV